MGLFGNLGRKNEEAKSRNIERFKNNKKKSEVDDILEIYYDEGDAEYGKHSRDYRERAFEDVSSNHGWYTCIKCGRKFRKGDMEIDHILPKSKGGDNSRYNLQCICFHCNRSKQDDTSNTDEDLKRRAQELKQQRKEDEEYLKQAKKNIESKKIKKKKG